MKKDKIIEGYYYTNGKGAVRGVVGVGPQYVSYRNQADTDCVRYRIIKGRMVGHEFNCTRTAFANWAQGFVQEETK